MRYDEAALEHNFKEKIYIKKNIVLLIHLRKMVLLIKKKLKNEEIN